MNTASSYLISMCTSSASALPIGSLSKKRFHFFLISTCMLTNLWIAPVMAIEPTAAPTAIPVLVVNVKQTVNGLAQAAYDADKDSCDLTIRYTVVQSMVGITIDQITEISVQDVEDTNYVYIPTPKMLTATADQCWMNYKIQTSNPSVTLTTIQTQLNGAVQSGQMEESLHYYAILFNATSLVNSTLSEPEVTNAVDIEHVDEDDAGELGGLVIGTAVFFALLVGLLLVYKIQYDSQIVSNATKKEPSKKIELL